MPRTLVKQKVINPITATGTLSARSLQDRFSDVVNVEDFGAVGDGITDDYNAILAAINYASSKKIPLLLKGKTYRISTQININSTVYIQGIGRDTVIVFDAGNINGLNILSTAPKTIIRDIRIQGAINKTTLGSGIILRSNNSILENIFVERFGGHGILCVPDNFTEIINPNILRCYVFDVGLIGISLIRAVAGYVDGCKMQNTGWEGFTFDTGPYGLANPDDGTDLSQCVNCFFDNNCLTGGVGAAGCDGSTGIIFTGNTITNCNDPSVGSLISDAGLFGNGFCAQNNLAPSFDGIISNNHFTNCRRGIFLKGRRTPTSAIENLSADGNGFCFSTTGFKVYSNTFTGISGEIVRDDNDITHNSYEGGLINFNAGLSANQILTIPANDIAIQKINLNLFNYTSNSTLTGGSVFVPVGGKYHINANVRVSGDLLNTNCAWASLVIQSTSLSGITQDIAAYNINSPNVNILELNCNCLKKIDPGTVTLYFRASCINTTPITVYSAIQTTNFTGFNIN